LGKEDKPGTVIKWTSYLPQLPDPSIPKARNATPLYWLYDGQQTI